jgi:hypothetical protein
VANPLGAAPGIMVGVGVGEAASAALEPVIEPARQQAWDKNRNAILDPGLMAQLAARGGVTLQAAKTTNHLHGLTDDKTEALVYLSQTLPGTGELDDLSNRRLISPGQVQEALTRHGIPADWHDALIAAMQDILTPGELAAAIHRGLVPSSGLLLGEQPEPPFKVEAYPVQPIDAVQEAQGSGYDKERLQVLVGLQGLPMGPHEAAQALFRGIITRGDYIRAFNTSNMRNEWAQAILDQTRQIPTARDFMENALRGYSDLRDALEGAKRHGMSEADATLIYQNQGRPMNIHAITQALARGAEFHPEPGEITDPYLAATVEGPIKPAYYEMFQALKYTLPSAFVMRQLANSGVWSEAKTAERLKWAGWFPEDADEAAKAWAAPTAETKANPWVAKAQQRFWTDAQNAFIKEGVERSVIEPVLQVFVPDPADRDAVFQYWTDARNVNSGEAPPA